MAALGPHSRSLHKSPRTTWETGAEVRLPRCSSTSTWAWAPSVREPSHLHKGPVRARGSSAGEGLLLSTSCPPSFRSLSWGSLPTHGREAHAGGATSGKDTFFKLCKG